MQAIGIRNVKEEPRMGRGKTEAMKKKKMIRKREIEVFEGFNRR